MKKWGIVFLCVGVVGICAFIYFEYQNRSKIYSGLTDRSKELLLSQKKSGGDLAHVATSQNQISEKEKQLTIPGCFSVLIPFRVKIINTNEGNACSRYIGLENPRGSIVVFTESVRLATVDDAPGVSMRKQNPIQYKEERFTLLDREYLAFADTTSGYQKTVFFKTEDTYAAVTLTLSDPTVADEKLRVMLSTFVFD